MCICVYIFKCEGKGRTRGKRKERVDAFFLQEREAPHGEELLVHAHFSLPSLVVSILREQKKREARKRTTISRRSYDMAGNSRPWCFLDCQVFRGFLRDVRTLGRNLISTSFDFPVE